MRLAWCACSLVMAGMLAGCATWAPPPGPEITPIVPAGSEYVNDRNPVYIPLDDKQYGRVFENVIQVLGDYGYTLDIANRYDGRIETKPRIAPGILLCLKPGSPNLYERCLATAQTYRHRVTVIIHPAAQGGYFIEVTARKELEDLSRPIQSRTGAAIFSIGTEIDRDFEVVDPNRADFGWIYKGRDPALEQELIRRMKLLM